jgi:hypothetical protein
LFDDVAVDPPIEPTGLADVKAKGDDWSMTTEQATYVSRVRVVRRQGPIREAYLPAEAAPVIFGTHDEIREHYGTAPGQYPERATTLDYLVAAAAG